jgi:hypothetical protein
MIEELPMLSDVSQVVVVVETVSYTVVVDEGIPGWEEKYDGLSLAHWRESWNSTLNQITNVLVIILKVTFGARSQPVSA